MLRGRLDVESRAWIVDLRGRGARYDEASGSTVLVRAARFEVSRRRASVPYLRGDEARRRPAAVTLSLPKRGSAYPG